MSIRVECGGCGKGIKAPDKFAGKSAKCPGCGESIAIPAGQTDDGFDDIMPEEPEEKHMPPEPTIEMQPIARGFSQPLKGPQEVEIVRIKIPIIDAIGLIITFWIASIVIISFLGLVVFLAIQAVMDKT